MSMPETLNASELRHIGEKLWGWGWQQRAAEHFQVNDRTVRRWAAGTVPVSVMEEMRALSAIVPPPDSSPDQDRDDACRLALNSELTDLRNRAVAAGWEPGEIATAILAMTIDELVDLAGVEETSKILFGARSMIGE